MRTSPGRGRARSSRSASASDTRWPPRHRREQGRAGRRRRAGRAVGGNEHEVEREADDERHERAERRQPGAFDATRALEKVALATKPKALGSSHRKGSTESL